MLNALDSSGRVSPRSGRQFDTVPFWRMWYLMRTHAWSILSPSGPLLLPDLSGHVALPYKSYARPWAHVAGWPCSRSCLFRSVLQGLLQVGIEVALPFSARASKHAKLLAHLTGVSSPTWAFQVSSRQYDVLSQLSYAWLPQCGHREHSRIISHRIHRQCQNPLRGGPTQEPHPAVLRCLWRAAPCFPPHHRAGHVPLHIWVYCQGELLHGPVLVSHWLWAIKL